MNLDKNRCVGAFSLVYYVEGEAKIINTYEQHRVTRADDHNQLNKPEG